MKKKIIIILAVIISVVLSGLIIIQIYWINNAIEAKNQQFRVYVNNALTAVVLDMEQQETIERIVEEIDIYEAGKADNSFKHFCDDIGNVFKKLREDFDKKY